MDTFEPNNETQEQEGHVTHGTGSTHSKLKRDIAAVQESATFQNLEMEMGGQAGYQLNA